MRKRRYGFNHLNKLVLSLYLNLKIKVNNNIVYFNYHFIYKY